MSQDNFAAFYEAEQVFIKFGQATYVSAIKLKADPPTFYGGRLRSHKLWLHLAYSSPSATSVLFLSGISGMNLIPDLTLF